MTREEDLNFEQMSRDLQTTFRVLEIEREAVHELCQALIQRGYLELLMECLLNLFHDGKIDWIMVQRLSHLSEQELDKYYCRTLAGDGT